MKNQHFIMNKEQFNKAIKELEKRGYKFEKRITQSSQDSYYKVIDRLPYDEEWEEERAYNQVFFKIWSFEEFKDRIHEDSMYNLEPIVTISRNISELISLHLNYPKRNVDEVERIAKEFGNWVKENIKLEDNEN